MEVKTEMSMDEFEKFAEKATLQDAQDYADRFGLEKTDAQTVSFVRQSWGHAFSSVNKVGESFYRILGHQGGNFGSNKLSEGDKITIKIEEGEQNLLVFKIKYFDNPRDMFNMYAVMCDE